MSIIVSFIIFCALPTALSAFYLWTRAVDRYASSAGLTIQTEGLRPAADGALGVASRIFSNRARHNESDILYEYLRSQELVERLDKDFDLAGHYSRHRDDDPLFSVKADATIEELTRYWGRTAIEIAYDRTTDLIRFRVKAFDPALAQVLATAIIDKSQRMIDRLNDLSRAEALRFAKQDLDDADTRLRGAREALELFRGRNQVVNLGGDLQGKLGVVNNLENRLADALVERDLLKEQAGPEDPRLVIANRKIDIVRARIKSEREAMFGNGTQEHGQDYPRMLAEFQELQADLKLAEQQHRVALDVMNLASRDSQRETFHVTTFVAPTLAESAEYPKKYTLVGMIAFFSFVGWAILSLVYYSVRDS